MTLSPAEALGFASELADIADAITMPIFGTSLRVETKADGSPVTEADQGAERAIREAIAATYPDHDILGEEEGGPGDTEATHRWILDPVDGTKNFAAGIPIWGTLIALEAEGEVIAGVVSCPAMSERYAAARGAGATLNGQPIAVSEHASLDGARVAYTSYGSFAEFGRADGFEAICRGAAWVRGLGDCWGHMLVASGRVEIMAEPIVNTWDIAPLIVIVEEAGGRFTDLDGARRIDGGHVLSTNGHVHDQALRGFRA